MSKKHIIQTVRKPATPPTKVESNPKKQASRKACRGKVNPSHCYADNG